MVEALSEQQDGQTASQFTGADGRAAKASLAMPIGGDAGFAGVAV